MSDSVRPHRWQPTRLPRSWDSPGKNIGVGAISFSNAWKWKVKVKSLSRVRLLATPWTAVRNTTSTLFTLSQISFFHLFVSGKQVFVILSKKHCIKQMELGKRHFIQDYCSRDQDYWNSQESLDTTPRKWQPGEF